MKPLRIYFPWARVQRGQGFFIPCLNPEAMRERGLKHAVRHRVLNARAVAAIHNGMHGVWFFRPPLTPPPS
jgi:hypothetical protein